MARLPPVERPRAREVHIHIHIGPRCPPPRFHLHMYTMGIVERMPKDVHERMTTDPLRLTYGLV